MRVPLKTTVLVTGLGYSFGDVVTDPTIPLQNIKADLLTSSIGISHAFNFFGLSSQALVVFPYAWAKVSGDIEEVSASVSRSGLADMRLRYSVLVFGGEAATLEELRNAKRNTIIGTSINIIAPTGQFFEDKLINLGTNRWSFRPELAISHPIGKRWLADFYSGVWFFTANNSFFPGDVVRTQKPMGAFQAHLSYNINPLFWVALDGTFYAGGKSSLNNIVNDDRAENTRLGITAVVPTGKFSSLKFAFSTGVIVRLGQDFTTLTLGWQKSWVSGLNK
ncbi:transporter [Shivajiella indica]|uniref:Transporter n=1 Tax=Shivajiella indica TaxID=872115 RepID=A0ABW5BFT2_9BACT